MREGLCLVLCTFSFTIRCVLLTPPTEIFGSIDLNTLKKNLVIPIHVNDSTYTNGVSLSFNLINVNDTTKSLLFSLYGYNGSISYVNQKCVISVTTQFNLSVTYSLSKCNDTNVVIELYPSTNTQNNLVNLYENLIYVNFDKDYIGNVDLSGTYIGWCEYNGKYIKDSLTNATGVMFEDTLEAAKIACLKQTNSACRGIVHTPSHPEGYQLRKGEIPFKAPEYDKFPEVTYLKAPCIGQRQNTLIDMNLVLYKQTTTIILSHVNVDQLLVNGHVDHSNMYKRYELGNLVPGTYVDFTSIPYQRSDKMYTYHPKLSTNTWTVTDARFTLNEGCLLQEVSDKEDYIELDMDDQVTTKKSRYVWKAGSSGYSLDVKQYCQYENTDITDKLVDVYITKEEAGKACNAKPDCKGFILSHDIFMPGSNITLAYQLAKGSLSSSSSSPTCTSWAKGYCASGGIEGTAPNSSFTYGIWCQYNRTIAYHNINTTINIASPSGYTGYRALQRALGECYLRSDCLTVMSLWDDKIGGEKHIMTKWDGDPSMWQGNGTAWTQCGKNHTIIDRWTNDGNLQLLKKNTANVFCYKRSYPLAATSVSKDDSGSSLSNSTSTHRCQWKIQDTTNTLLHYMAIITFKSDTNASKFYFSSKGTIIQHLLYHNRSSTAAYLFKFKLEANNVTIEVTSGARDCGIVLYRTDVCEPMEKTNNYGHYYLNRTLSNTAAESGTCDGNPDKPAKWECSSTGEWKYVDKCPFYQCYGRDGRTRDVAFVKPSGVVASSTTRVGENKTGECCNGTWLFECREGYSINYSDCVKLKDCPAKSVSFSVTETTTTGKDVIYSTACNLIKAKESDSVACPYGNGSIRVSCDGCMNDTVIKVEKPNCGPKNCIKSMFSDPKYGRVNITFPRQGLPVWGDKVVTGCPYSTTGATFTATCVRGNIVMNYRKCDEAPMCEGEKMDMGGNQIGNITWPDTYAAETAEVECKYTGFATMYCTWNGTWADPINECQKRTYCEPRVITYLGVNFTLPKTEGGEISNTTCSDPMCDDHSKKDLTELCGFAECNKDTSIFGEPNYEFCEFNCTDSDGTILTVGMRSSTTCTRKNGDEGRMNLECTGSGVLHTVTVDCLLKTCTEDNPAGCFSMDSSSSSAEEQMAALDSGIDKIDLTSDSNKALVAMAVTAIIPASDNIGSAKPSDLLKIVDLVSKVTTKLAETGGEIITDAVTMYGIQLESDNLTRRKRAVVTDESRGITGTGFTAGIGVAVYNSDSMFKSDATADEKSVAGDGKVMSITTAGDQDVSISMAFKNDNGSKTADIFSCVYYDRTNFTWSDEGCDKNPTLMDDKLVCKCNHLTSFAVLVSLDATNSHSQDVASNILLTISAVCLVLTLSAILPHKKIREKQIMKVHLNLTVSLLLATIAFLMIGYGNSRPKACYFVAFMVHWLWLAVFGWMIVEGITLYRQTVQALQSYGRPIPWYILKNFIAVYGGSLIFPVLGVIIGETTSWEYTSQPTCFLNAKNTLIVFFLVPLYIVLVISIFFFVRVSYVIINAKKQGSAGKAYLKKQLKAIISIAVVLGVAWIIAPFINIAQGSDAKRALEWLFSIMCGSQGITVFIIQVVFSDDVKNSWMGTYKDSDFEKMTESVIDKSRRFKGSLRATLSSKIKLRTEEELEYVSSISDTATAVFDDEDNPENHINNDLKEQEADNTDPTYDEAHVETVIIDPEHCYVSPNDVKT